VTQPDERIDRLRELSAELSAPVSTPDEDAGDDVWNPWMEQQGADGDLAGLISQAIHGARFHPGELKLYREASERFGSCLTAESVAEAYRLLEGRP
jgi:hypothetical protein